MYLECLTCITSSNSFAWESIQYQNSKNERLEELSGVHFLPCRQDQKYQLQTHDLPQIVIHVQNRGRFPCQINAHSFFNAYFSQKVSQEDLVLRSICFWCASTYWKLIIMEIFSCGKGGWQSPTGACNIHFLVLDYHILIKASVCIKMLKHFGNILMFQHSLAFQNLEQFGNV